MKIKKLFIGVFAATYLLGCLAFVVYVSYNSSKKMSSKNNLPSIKFTKEKPESELDAKLMNSCCYRDNFAETISADKYQTETDFGDAEFKPEIFGINDTADYDEPNFKIKLLNLTETGNNFRKDEVVAKSGEIWLGLFEENGKFLLRKTKLKIIPEDRPHYGWDDSVTVKFKDKSESVFLLKNAKSLDEGEITTLWKPVSFEKSDEIDLKTRTLDKDFKREFYLGERKYTLKVKQGITDENNKVSVLILESGQTSQIVTFNGFYEKGDNIGDILWVGDLDRDGKLDFYMSHYSYEKGGFNSSLFLSSEAEKGKLVKEAAIFGTSGC